MKLLRALVDLVHVILDDHRDEATIRANRAQCWDSYWGSPSTLYGTLPTGRARRSRNRR